RCYLRLPPPATPPLFPYTTLFRSPNQLGAGHRDAEHAFRTGHVVLGRDRDAGRRDGGPDRAAVERIPLRVVQRPDGMGIQHVPEDRKSTRLNSSHVKISYAVFCLK